MTDVPSRDKQARQFILEYRMVCCPPKRMTVRGYAVRFPKPFRRFSFFVCMAMKSNGNDEPKTTNGFIVAHVCGARMPYRRASMQAAIDAAYEQLLAVGVGELRKAIKVWRR